MPTKTSFLVTAFCWMLACTTHAQQQPKTSISQLSFMKGKWFVAHQWGDMEEFWGEPMGNNMISSYRCVKDGKVIFYEFVVIEQTDSVPVMYLRHFKPHSIAWEDKENPGQYPLISLTGNKATFKSKDGDVILSYELKSQNALEVVLEEKNKKGELERTAFNYVRKPE